VCQHEIILLHSPFVTTIKLRLWNIYGLFNTITYMPAFSNLKTILLLLKKMLSGFTLYSIILFNEDNIHLVSFVAAIDILARAEEETEILQPADQR